MVTYATFYDPEGNKLQMAGSPPQGSQLMPKPSLTWCAPRTDTLAAEQSDVVKIQSRFASQIPS